MNVRAAKTAFLAAGAACLGQAAYMYARLPARVASHFGPSGAPNGWMPRELFVGIYVFVVVLLGAMMLGTAYTLPRTPDNRVNLPHKEYWLAPERRAETYAWLQNFFFWSGIGTFALLFDVFRQALRVNLGAAARLEHPLFDLALYVLYAVGWVVAMMRRFSKVPAGA